MDKYLKKIYGQTAALLLFAALSLSSNTVNAQEGKVTQEDYPKWGALGMPKLAPDGKWVVFSMSYKDGRDTMFVVGTERQKTFRFPKGSFVSYGKDGWLAFRMAGKLVVFNPSTKKERHFENVGGYTFSATGKYCIYDSTDANGKSLRYYDFITGREEIISTVDDYKFNSKADAVVFSKGSQLWLHFPATNKKRVIDSHPDGVYSKLGWQDQGKAISFIVLDSTSHHVPKLSAGLYDMLADKVFKIQLYDREDFSGKQIHEYSDMQVSKDCKRVFIPLQDADSGKDYPVDEVEVWNALSKEIYPRQKMRATEQRKDIWTWWPETGRLRQITDSIYVEMALNGDQKYALLWNPRDHEPHPNLAAPIDYYLYDVETGVKQLLLERHPPAEITALLSPGGKYLSYFKDKHWFVYDFLNHKHTCLTASIKGSFFKEDFDWPEDAPPYGNPGWAEDDNYIILYDQFDIWRIRPDGSGAEKITDGRQTKTTYRLCILPEQRNKVNYDGLTNGVFKTDGPYVLRQKSAESVGYSLWKNNSPLVKLLSGTVDMGSESYNDDGDIAVIEQTFRMPPTIIFKEQGKNKKELYQSNRNLAGLIASDAKLIEYRNSKGELLKGTLYFPVDYKSTKHYPMIVHIYQKQAWDHQRYVNPSLENVSGFNIRHLTISGYFVFLPDINYKMGSPLELALDCVTAGVAQVLKSESVDPCKIGLIGHSFGGYETDYIISQTDIFAAAVGGSAINDLVSFYHYVVPGFERPNFWFTEHGQFRMAQPYFSDREGYTNNSPLYHAHQINTPLLSWAGRNDTQVHYYQMLELHLALRRLGKVNCALLYNGQGHVLSSPKMQKDLTLKISDWFGHFLMGKPEPSWMKP